MAGGHRIRRYTMAGRSKASHEIAAVTTIRMMVTMVLSILVSVGLRQAR